MLYSLHAYWDRPGFTLFEQDNHFLIDFYTVWAFLHTGFRFLPEERMQTELEATAIFHDVTHLQQQPQKASFTSFAHPVIL